jgi:hypothetical protein
MTTMTQTLLELAESRSEFLRQVPNLAQPQREVLVQQFLTTEQSYLTVMHVILSRQAALNISFPIDFQQINTASFLNPVLVVASPEQIAAEIQPYMHPTTQQCAICQDDISSDGARLRVCQHSFHRSCIQTWFGASVRCPMCRRDIREDPAAQTSSASTGISFQAENQWGERI